MKTNPKAPFSDAEVQNFFDNYYVDRGMAKWQGFYLSDHTSALKSEKSATQDKLSFKAQPQMEPAQISQIIETALIKQVAIKVQINVKDTNGIFENELSGYIRGFSERGLYLDSTVIDFEVIRNVEMLNNLN